MSICPWRGFAAAFLLTLASTASGHSTTDATRPADGAVLDATPAEIRIRFDEPIRITMVRIVDNSGDEYDVTYDRGEATEALTATPESLPSGAYTVKWRGLSEDGHPASGELDFRIE